MTPVSWFGNDPTHRTNAVYGPVPRGNATKRQKPPRQKCRGSGPYEACPWRFSQ